LFFISEKFESVKVHLNDEGKLVKEDGELLNTPYPPLTRVLEFKIRESTWKQLEAVIGMKIQMNPDTNFDQEIDKLLAYFLFKEDF
jgi:hypothetical protein